MGVALFGQRLGSLCGYIQSRAGEAKCASCAFFVAGNMVFQAPDDFVAVEWRLYGFVVQQ